MHNGSRWTIADVAPEARQAACMAARKAGLSVGEWLSQTILSAAASELKSGRMPPHIQPGHPGGYAPPAPTPQAVLEAIQKLSGRIAAAEQRTAESLKPLAEKVVSLSARLEELQAQKSVGTAPVERAVTRLAERLDKIEELGGGREKAKRRGFFSRLF